MPCLQTEPVEVKFELIKECDVHKPSRKYMFPRLQFLEEKLIHRQGSVHLYVHGYTCLYVLNHSSTCSWDIVQARGRGEGTLWCHSHRKISRYSTVMSQDNIQIQPCDVTEWYPDTALWYLDDILRQHCDVTEWYPDTALWYQDDILRQPCDVTRLSPETALLCHRAISKYSLWCVAVVGTTNRLYALSHAIHPLTASLWHQCLYTLILCTRIKIMIKHDCQQKKVAVSFQSTPFLFPFLAMLVCNVYFCGCSVPY